MSTKSSQTLSPEFRRLADEMRRIRFGRIENLAIRSGVPVFDPATRILRDIRLDEKADGKPAVEQRDFLLSDALLNLIRHLGEVGDGVVVSLDILHGLPQRMRVSELAG